MVDGTMASSGFVGRASDITEVIDLIHSTRLLTIVGAGGMGKTSLAHQVVARIEPELPDRVVFVELGDVHATEMTSATVAAALGHRSIAALVAAADDPPTLLVLDNCEHVRSEVAEVATMLLDHCPDLRILATSRAPLEIAGEYVRPLRPMPIGEACSLLRERGIAAGADRFDDDALEPLVLRVDAMPLALELAAIRLRSLSPVEIVDALNEGLAMLRANPLSRTASSDRHASLDSAISWSYELLTDGEAEALRRLTVLPAPFDIDRAHAVLSTVAASRIETADLLDRLVSQSMVATDRSGGRITYRLMETLRQFGAERLDERERADTTDRYLAFVAFRAGDIVDRALTEWTEDVVAAAIELGTDLLVAPRFCSEFDEDGRRACAMFLPVWGLVHEHRAGEFATLGAHVLERWPSSTPGWGDVAAITATASMRTFEAADAEDQANQAMRAGGLIAEPVAHRVFAMLHQHRGDFDIALGHVRAGLAAAEIAALAPFEAELQVFEATLLAQLGRLDEAAEAAQAAQLRNRDLGSVPVATWALVLRAYVLADLDPDRSRELLAAAERELDYDGPQWIVARHLGLLAARRGDLDTACRELRSALIQTRRAGEVPHNWATLREIAVLGITAGMQPLDDAVSLLRLVQSSEDTPAPGVLEIERLNNALEQCHIGQATRPDLAPSDLGMYVLDQIEINTEEPSTSPPPAEPTPSQSASFVRTGDIWALGWRGNTADLTTSKGMVDLARLLSEPAREVHVLELMGAAVDESPLGAAIDVQARRQYEDRLRDLQVELDEAELINDTGRAERAQTEFDQIVDALTGSLGLSGRQREAGGTAEKARSAVRWRIRAAIKKIDEHLPGLARHLQVSVKTGAWCSYDPETVVEWTLS